MIDEFITAIFGDIVVPDILLAVVIFFAFAFAFEGIVDILKTLLKAGRM